MDRNIKVRITIGYNSIKENGGLGRWVNQNEEFWITEQRAIDLVKKGLVIILEIKRKCIYE